MVGEPADLLLLRMYQNVERLRQNANFCAAKNNKRIPIRKSGLTIRQMNPTPLMAQAASAACPLLLILPAAGGQPMLDTTGVPWIDGATHPIDEVTHVCALVVLGIAAALLGGRSRWGLPLMFTILLAFGIVLGTQGPEPPMIDTIVLTTGLALVLLIIAKVHVVFATIACLTGAYALFHGVADGYIIRATQLSPDYITGYLVSNVVMILAGLIVGEWIHRHLMRWGELLHHLIDRFRGLKHV